MAKNISPIHGIDSAKTNNKSRSDMTLSIQETDLVNKINYETVNHKVEVQTKPTYNISRIQCQSNPAVKHSTNHKVEVPVNTEYSIHENGT